MRCQVRLLTSSPDPSDVFQNTWFLENPLTSDLALMADQATPRFKNFYQALASYYGDFVQSAEIRFYDMADPPPRIPEVRDMLYSPGHDPAQGNLPEEVAVVLTIHGTPPVTPRRRGRLYLGPLCTTALSSVPEQATRVSDQLVDAIAARAVAFKQDASGGDWVIYSPTSGFAVSVAGGWVDNAFDSQRRRGPDASSRTTW